MTPTRRHLEFAAGYLALGMLAEASDELEAIEGEDRLLPEVLFVRSDLYMKAEQWDLLLAVARELARKTPKHQEGWVGWAYALRALNRVEEARAVLLEAEPIHGETCDVLHYNLACYACLLNDQAEAKRRLSMACKMGRRWKKIALDDEDLKAM